MKYEVETKNLKVAMGAWKRHGFQPSGIYDAAQLLLDKDCDAKLARLMFQDLTRNDVMCKRYPMCCSVGWPDTKTILHYAIRSALTKLTCAICSDIDVQDENQPQSEYCYSF